VSPNAALLTNFDAGQKAALARVVSIVENHRPGFDRILAQMQSRIGQARRIGGVADAIAREIQTITGKETRSLVLGHLQRGGMPTGYDRLLATRFGGAAVRAIADEKWGQMVALQSPHIVTIPIDEVLGEVKRVDPTHDVVQTARATGISFGD